MSNFINKEASPESSGLYNNIHAASIALNAARNYFVQNIETASDADKTNIYGMDLVTDLGGYTPWNVVADRVKQAFAISENFSGLDLGYDTRIYELANTTLHYINPVSTQAKNFRTYLISFRDSVWKIADYADVILWLDGQGESGYISSTFGIDGADIATVRNRLSGSMKYIRNADNTKPEYVISAGERPYFAALLHQTILKP